VPTAKKKRPEYSRGNFRLIQCRLYLHPCIKSVVFAIVVVAGCSLALAATPTLSVSGSIDASNVMHINTGSVSWTHNTGVGPTALTVNGTPWNPTAQPTLNLPPPLIPSPLSGYFVHTSVSSGASWPTRRSPAAKSCSFSTTPTNGADNYSAVVSFTAKPPPTLTPSATLHITGSIDGSDTLRITNASATWIHNAWDPPSNVMLNGMAWNTVSNPTLPNSGATTFLPRRGSFHRRLHEERRPRHQHLPAFLRFTSTSISPTTFRAQARTTTR
jgi:hypothetical protein